MADKRKRGTSPNKWKILKEQERTRKDKSGRTSRNQETTEFETPCLAALEGAVRFFSQIAAIVAKWSEIQIVMTFYEVL